MSIDAYDYGVSDGVKQEQERILTLLSKFWCQEVACTKHPVRMDWVIDAIKGEK